VRIIDQNQLDRLSGLARENTRLRKNLNIHPNDEFCCHRLLNAMEPDSYIRPHRHLDPVKDETFVLIRGKLGVIMFDEQGEVVEKALMEPAGVVILDIPHGLFHTAVSLEQGTIFFEAKAGPYIPITAAEKADWSPEDGTPAVPAYLERLKALF
jgi:cupin fold WbuC family metalloprotein